MSRRKKPVLTASYCLPIEKLLLALEVMTGKRVRLLAIDFNRKTAQVAWEEVVEDVSFHEHPLDVEPGYIIDIYFRSHHDRSWDEWDFLRACYLYKDRKMRVMRMGGGGHRLRGHLMWIAGRSFVDRWEEPLDPNEVLRAAQARGLAVETYLNS